MFVSRSTAASLTFVVSAVWHVRQLLYLVTLQGILSWILFFLLQLCLGESDVQHCPRGYQANGGG